jgi:hydrogenase nickel incorporation protein HypB
MCGVCGCGEGETRVEKLEPRAHEHAATTSAEVVALREEPAEEARRVKIEQDILAGNNAIAAHNRAHFASHGVLALNLVSSPGAGKTSLLVAALERLQGSVPVAVIEGDQETSADAERIRSTGTPALQVNTGKGCHLDAKMIDRAFAELHIHDGVLMIENVGNLVCPAGFDLGEAHKVVIASVTEGEDKPLKYPNMFAASSLMLVSKVDLLPHLDFDVDELIANARKVNPNIAVIHVSARTGEGLDRWLQWIDAARSMAAASHG